MTARVLLSFFSDRVALFLPLLDKRVCADIHIMYIYIYTCARNSRFQIYCIYDSDCSFYLQALDSLVLLLLVVNLQS